MMTITRLGLQARQFKQWRCPSWIKKWTLMDGLLADRENLIGVRLLGPPTWVKNGLVTVISALKGEKRDLARKLHQDTQRRWCRTWEFQKMVEYGDIDHVGLLRRTMRATWSGKEVTDSFDTSHWSQQSPEGFRRGYHGKQTMIPKLVRWLCTNLSLHSSMKPKTIAKDKQCAKLILMTWIEMN